MTPYAILKFVHVLLAITAVGGNITYGLWLARAERAPQHLEYVLRGVKFLDDRVANPAYALLLVTGVAMLYTGHVAWQTPWLLTALVLYALLVVLGLGGYTPTLRAQIAALQAGGPRSADYTRLAGRARRLGILNAVVVLAILFLMVTKPALWR